MKCSGCGAHLPLRSYGEVRCDYCQTLNYISVPGETGEVAEKVGSKEKPVKIEEIQKPGKPLTLSQNGPTCPKCKSFNVIEYERNFFQMLVESLFFISVRFECQECGKRF